jgi:hypothetical protein
MRATLTRTLARYRRLDIEYAALKVVGRGLFMIVMLMVVFLYIFTRVTDLIDGANEVLIPTVAVNPDVDLGALAQEAFSRTSASVVSVIGAFTLVISALFTAHALRQGTQRALLGDQATPTRLLSWRTTGIAVALAAAILTTWLLTLGTAIRHRAWTSLLGRETSTIVVDAGKVLAVAASLGLIAGVLLIVTRIVRGHVTRRSVVAAGLLAVVIVAMNFFLLYTYVGALINPAVSAGIVLVFTLLLWVNVCARAYLGALCWIGSDD